MAVFQVISIVLSALVLGVFWGPWVGLTRSLVTFEPEAFLAIVKRLSTNLAPVMTILMPAALLSMVPVLIFAFGQLFAVVLALLPAVLLAAGIFVAARFWLHLLLPEGIATSGAMINEVLSPIPPVLCLSA